MELQRPVALLGCAAALAATLSACAGSSSPPASASADASKRLVELREQQIHLTDELRGLKAEIAELSSLVRRGPDGVPSEPPAPPSAAAPAVAAADSSAAGEPAVVPSVAPSRAPEAFQATSPASAYVAVARQLIDGQDFATAVRVLNVAADLDPGYDATYFWRGVARHLLQSYADAIDDFQASIQRTSRQDARYICLYNQACALARLGRADEATDKLVQADEAGFRKLIEQMTTDPDLDSLRDLPRFKDFVMMLRTR